MVMPPGIMWYKLQKKIKNMSDRDKISEIQKFVNELPVLHGRADAAFSFQKLRNLANAEIKRLAGAKRTKHNSDLDFSVQKQGKFQFVIAGPPNIGKSSLLEKLCGKQVKIGDFDFTTIQPVSSMLKLYGTEIQLVEIPGLIEGAAEGKGNGRQLLSIAKTADKIILMCEAGRTERFYPVIKELKKAEIQTKGCLLICNKCESPEAEEKADQLKEKYPELNVIPISIKTGKNLDLLKEKIWGQTGFMRIYAKPTGKEKADNPMALPNGSTIRDFILELHKEILKSFQYARIWGRFVRFPGQQVGLDHALMDRDIVELHYKK